MKHEQKQDPKKKIDFIYYFIRRIGECTQKAQSDWGKTVNEWRNISVGDTDAGYSFYVQWGSHLSCHYTYGREDIVYHYGSEKELDKLYHGLHRHQARIAKNKREK